MGREQRFGYLLIAFTMCLGSRAHAGCLARVCVDLSAPPWGPQLTGALCARETGHGIAVNQSCRGIKGVWARSRGACASPMTGRAARPPEGYRRTGGASTEAEEVGGTATGDRLSETRVMGRQQNAGEVASPAFQCRPVESELLLLAAAQGMDVDRELLDGDRVQAATPAGITPARA